MRVERVEKKIEELKELVQSGPKWSGGPPIRVRGDSRVFLISSQGELKYLNRPFAIKL